MQSFKMRKMEQQKKQILSSIETLEKKRKRSEFALTDCLLSDRELDPEDVKYFNYYTAEIRVLGEELEQLESAIKKLKVFRKTGCLEL